MNFLQKITRIRLPFRTVNKLSLHFPQRLLFILQNIVIIYRIQVMQQTMVKALTEIISVDIGQNLVSMSIVEKQNESGLKFNERLFIVVHGVFFGYLSKVKMNESPNKINIEQAKVKVPMKNLYSVEIVDQIMTIKFTVQENGKLVPKEWVMKAASAKMANFWKQLMQYQLKMRKASPIKQSSASPQKSKSKPSEAASPPLQQKKETKPKQPQKKQSSELKRTPKVFQNPLFQDSDPEEDERPKRQSGVRQKSNEKARASQQKNNIIESKKEPESKLENKSESISESKSEIKPEVKPEIKAEGKSAVRQQSKSLLKSQVKQENNALPPKRQLLIPLQLEKIQQQPIEDTPNMKNSRLTKQSKTPSRANQKSPTKNKESSKKQQQRISQKFDLGIKQSEFINTVLKDLDESNEKYPIRQLTYKHEDVEKIMKIYGKSLSLAHNDNNKTQKLLEYILGSQKQKMSRSISKLSVPDGSPWVYKQIILDEVENLVGFRNKCKELMKILYVQVYNKQYSKFLKIKQQNHIIVYEVQDLQVKVPQITFKKSSTNINLLDRKAEQLIKNQFKYLKHLYKVIKNEDKIRVPYSCLCQFGGIIALFKAKCIFGQTQSVMQEINSAVNNLEIKSKLGLQNILKNKIKPLKELYYNNLRHGDTNVSFKYYIISDVQNMFPCDLTNNNTTHERQLRMELIQKEFKQKIVPYSSNEDIKNKSDVKHLFQLSEALSRKINSVITTLSQGSFYFLNPAQLSTFLHSQGINMRHLKTIYQKVNVSFIKSLIASEMVSRIIKAILCKTLQDECFELSSRKQTQQKASDLNNLLKQKCIDFLNCVFGVGPQSDAIWELINKNFQAKYQINIQIKSEINKGQLIISVAHHCNVIIDWAAIQIAEIFNSQQFLKKQSVKQLNVLVKSYEPAQSKLKYQLQQKIKEITHQNFEFITHKLKLKSEKFPKELSLYRNFTNQIKVYLANFIQPQQLDWGNNYSHLSIYQGSEPTIFSFKTDLCMLKWFLKTNKKHKYLNKFSQFSSKISKLYGNNHPLLSEMYQIFSQHHKSKGQMEDSINFMKSSLLNYSAIFGDQNINIANNYYKIGILLVGYNRLYEAEQYLIKAKQIMDHIRTDKSLLDAKIRLSLATIYFQDQKYKQSYDLIANRVGTFEEYEDSISQSYERQRAQMYQLIYYCQSKLNSKAECSKICSSLEKKISYFKQHNNFAQILYIIVDSYLNNLSSQLKEAMHKLINMIPTKPAINYYKKSYDLLVKRYNQKNLFGSFKKYTENAGKLVDMIVQKNLLKVWENLSKIHERETLFDFVSLVEQLIYFLGRDRLNTI